MGARARVASTAEHKPAAIVAGVVLLLHFCNVIRLLLLGQKPVVDGPKTQPWLIATSFCYFCCNNSFWWVDFLLLSLLSHIPVFSA